MKNFLVAILAAALVGACGLTPDQIVALDGAMCTKTKIDAGADGENTTVIVGGASKAGAIMVNGSDCSVATAGAPK